jgi:roadblock/LC7 domain-containing protein
MVDLERLVLLPGVVAALRFNDDGAPAEAVGDLDQVDVQLAAELCYANGRFMHHNSDMLMTFSGKAGWPARGWMMNGARLSVCGAGEVACFVRNGEASLNALFRILDEI